MRHSLNGRVARLQARVADWDPETLMHQRIRAMSPQERQSRIKELLREVGVPEEDVDTVFQSHLQMSRAEVQEWLNDRRVAQEEENSEHPLVSENGGDDA